MDYLRAAQPRVVALFLVTTLAAMLLCGAPPALWAAVALVATALTVGGAALLNNTLERDVDRRMARTRRRPTASGRIAPARAAGVGAAAVVTGALVLALVGGSLAALFALLGAAYYVAVYTLLLKPRSALSAVPGGVAGVFPALIGWAVTGAPWSGEILFLCLLIPLWSPPHSWALTLALADEYRASGIPNPPARYGDAATARLIAVFLAAVTIVLAVPLASGLFGWVYLAGALPAALLLWGCAAPLLRRAEPRAAWRLFKISGPCLALVLVAAVADTLL